MTSAGRGRENNKGYDDVYSDHGNSSPLRGSKGASTRASTHITASRARETEIRQPRFPSPVKEETENGLMKMLNE